MTIDVIFDIEFFKIYSLKCKTKTEPFVYCSKDLMSSIWSNFNYYCTNLLENNESLPKNSISLSFHGPPYIQCYKQSIFQKMRDFMKKYFIFVIGFFKIYSINLKTKTEPSVHCSKHLKSSISENANHYCTILLE